MEYLTRSQIFIKYEGRVKFELLVNIYLRVQLNLDIFEYIFREGHIWIFVFLMIWAPKLRHSKTICRNTLFVKNAYLLSYITNNVNALIIFIVHNFLNYISHFLHICLTLLLLGGGALPPKPLWVRIISLLFVNLKD